MSTNTAPTKLDVSGLDAFQVARVRGYIDRILDEEAEKAAKENATEQSEGRVATCHRPRERGQN